MLLCLILYAFDSLHSYLHIQHGVSMLIFNMVLKPPFVTMVFYPYSVFESNLCLPWCFFLVFIFFGFPLLPSKLSGIIMPSLEVVSILQDHYLPQTTVTKPNLFKGSSQPYQISRFHQASILSLRGGVRDILAH